jgi:hypothetical protein
MARSVPPGRPQPALRFATRETLFTTVGAMFCSAD